MIHLNILKFNYDLETNFDWTLKHFSKPDSNSLLSTEKVWKLHSDVANET